MCKWLVLGMSFDHSSPVIACHLIFILFYRTVQMTVLNSLVGRIIGRGGSKINGIQVRCGLFLGGCSVHPI